MEFWIDKERLVANPRSSRLTKWLVVWANYNVPIAVHLMVVAIAVVITGWVVMVLTLPVQPHAYLTVALIWLVVTAAFWIILALILKVVGETYLRYQLRSKKVLRVPAVLSELWRGWLLDLTGNLHLLGHSLRWLEKTQYDTLAELSEGYRLDVAQGNKRSSYDRLDNALRAPMEQFLRHSSSTNS